MTPFNHPGLRLEEERSAFWTYQPYYYNSVNMLIGKENTGMLIHCPISRLGKRDNYGSRMSAVIFFPVVISHGTSPFDSFYVIQGHSCAMVLAAEQSLVEVGTVKSLRLARKLRITLD